MTDPGTSGLRLTEWTTCGGVRGEVGRRAAVRPRPRELAGQADAALLVGLAPFDDAAVYRISDDLAVVSTTDFFPPLVDDPADFGAIAAANACSDVFAMGGRVTTALNIAAFPERLPVEAIEAILPRPRPRWSRPPAGRWSAATPSAARSRSSGWRCRASSTRTGCSPRVGRARATCSCCPSRSALASCWPGGRTTTRRRPSTGMRG